MRFNLKRASSKHVYTLECASSAFLTCTLQIEARVFEACLYFGVHVIGFFDARDNFFEAPAGPSFIL